MEPPFLAAELYIGKLLLWLTLECFRRNLFEKWTGRTSTGSLSFSVCDKEAEHETIPESPFLEILDLPLTCADYQGLIIFFSISIGTHSHNHMYTIISILYILL